MSSKSTASRARFKARARVGGILLAAPALFAVSGSAQSDESFLMRTSPTPSYSDTPQRDYNLKWGPITGRLTATMQAEFSDNINLDDTSPQSDLYFFPNFGIGFQWPISPQNILELNLGAGYRYYIDHSELNTFQVSPDTRLLYQMRAGKITLAFHDSFHLQVDPLSRADVSGGGTGILNFKRINNDVGLQAEWQARSNFALVSSYSYLIDRSINSEFASLDRDDHTFALGGFSKIGSAWTVGLNGGITITDYLLPIQNDGVSQSIGPQVTVKISRFISAEAGISFTHSEYDQSGVIGDRSSFDGLSYFVGVRHNMNSKLSHNLRVANSISPGFGSNFNELTVAQYGINWRFNSFLTLNSTFSYEHLAASGAAGERADRFLAYLGTGWQVARRWNLGVGYSFAWKNSDKPLRDYQQNRFTLDLTHNF